LTLHRYNIDKIRAIPFAMVLAQMREFTGAYYGTGTAFEKGSQFLADAPTAALHLLAAALLFENETTLMDKLASNYNSNLLLLLKQVRFLYRVHAVVFSLSYISRYRSSSTL
jgi:phosphoenolpyruvate carboxylase